MLHATVNDGMDELTVVAYEAPGPPAIEAVHAHDEAYWAT
jgi:hypothetical protein